MDESSTEPLTRKRITNLRKRWSAPDSSEGRTWEVDGVYLTPDHPNSYSNEMSEGLKVFNCSTFDELTLFMGDKLGRKPNVIDLMGGAYFLNEPQNVNTLVGVRVHDKDTDFISAYEEIDDELFSLTKKIISAPNRRIVEADLLTTDGWKVLKNSEVPSADLMVCRPMGPFDNQLAVGGTLDDPASYAGLYMSLFGRMAKLVNKDNGVIFTEVPDIYSDDEIDKFFSLVDEKEGSKTNIFMASDDTPSAGGVKRRYAVIRFGGGLES